MNERAQQLTDKAITGLVEALARGESKTLRTYLSTMAKFHRYSWHNCILIWTQRETATQVAGYGKWKLMGRQVRKGEHGILILVPIFERRPKAEDVDKKASQEVVAFTAGYVFDIEQTEGEPLPTIGRRSGDPSYHMPRLLQFAEDQGIEVSFFDDLNGAHGRSKGGKIEVLNKLSSPEQFAVLVHELAHELLHQGEHKGLKPKSVRETEAEAVAHVVCEAVGIQNNTATQDYIQLYQGDTKLLMASLADIQRASSLILREVLD